MVLNSTNENKSGKMEHSMDCTCDKCFAEFQDFIKNFDPTTEEKLRLVESLRADLFKRVLKQECQIAKLRSQLSAAQKKAAFFDKWANEIERALDDSPSITTLDPLEDIRAILASEGKE